MRPTPRASYCTFDGTFTRQEKRGIIDSLYALDLAVDEPYREEGVKWHVSRTEVEVKPDDADPYKLRARSESIDVDILGRSVENLIEQIDKITELVSGG